MFLVESQVSTRVSNVGDGPEGGSEVEVGPSDRRPYIHVRRLSVVPCPFV